MNHYPYDEEDYDDSFYDYDDYSDESEYDDYEKKLGMYLEVLKSFRINHPSSARKMRCWYPVGRFDIMVVLNDGSRIYYDFFKRSIREVSRSPEEKLNRNKEVYRNEFARRLKIKLREEGVTQLMLSEMTGINRNTISSYVRGTRLPDTWNLELIASAIPCSPLELIDFE